FTKENVLALLQEELQQMQGGDSLLFIYSGHGSYDSKDVSKNALRLWGEVHLDANEFDAALDIAPAGATVRYVLPQCYSGGFTRSILSNPARPTISGFKPNRCGFFSVDERNL